MFGIYVTKKDVKDLVKVAYPEYKGRKFKIKTATTYRLHNYWDGGSIDKIKFAKWNPEIEQWVIKEPPPETKNPFNKIAHETIDIPKDILFVEHSIFAGKDLGITIYMHPESIYAPLLLESETAEPLSKWEKIVLLATRKYKSSYAGIKNYRFLQARRETGITRECWECTKEELIKKGYLTKKGSLTIKGKNAIDKYFYFDEILKEV